MDNDEQFLGYVEIHSETDRALFHINDVNRFLKLAGDNRRVTYPEFIAMHSYDINDLLIQARKNVRKK